MPETTVSTRIPVPPPVTQDGRITTRIYYVRWKIIIIIIVTEKIITRRFI